MNVTAKRTIDFQATTPNRRNTAETTRPEFSGDSVDLSGAQVKSAVGNNPYLCLGAANQTKANIEGGLLWCTSGAAEVKSNLDDGPAFWCTGGSTDVKSNIEGGLLWCTSDTTEVKSNIEGGLLWCTSGAAEVKSKGASSSF